MTGWGWEYILQAFSSPISQPYIIYYSPAHIDMYFFSFHPCTNSKWHISEEQRNKRTQFVIFSLSRLDSKQTHIFLQVLAFIVLYLCYDCFWSWSQIYCLWCLHAVRLSPAPNVYILDIISGCLYSILGHNENFHFLCHNAIAQISLRGITLLEKQITYVVSQTHPSSHYPTGADDQWVCQCHGLRTKRGGKRKKRVFWKHVT